MMSDTRVEESNRTKLYLKDTAKLDLRGPINGYIIPECAGYFDLPRLKSEVVRALETVSELDLYVNVNHLPAVAEVVNYCAIHEIKLTVWYMDDTWIPQVLDN